MTQEDYIDLVVAVQMILNEQLAQLASNFNTGITNRTEYRLEWEQRYRQYLNKIVPASALYSETRWPILAS
jgi:hypothetical protein